MEIRGQINEMFCFGYIGNATHAKLITISNYYNLLGPVNEKSLDPLFV